MHQYLYIKCTPFFTFTFSQTGLALQLVFNILFCVFCFCTIKKYQRLGLVLTTLSGYTPRSQKTEELYFICLMDRWRLERALYEINVQLSELLDPRWRISPWFYRYCPILWVSYPMSILSHNSVGVYLLHYCCILYYFNPCILVLIESIKDTLVQSLKPYSQLHLCFASCRIVFEWKRWEKDVWISCTCCWR